MKHSLFLLLVLFGSQVNAQKWYSSNPDHATLFPTEYGTFEGYAFVLDGKVIEQGALVDYPGATLNNIFPNALTLDGNRYPGAVYFHTQERYAPPVMFADDPAYFINGTQVSPFDIRSSKVAFYSRIEKSTQDTVIDGVRYHGAIHVDTDEDFFAQRPALSELIEKHTGLSPEKVIVHWRGSSFRYTNQSDLGTIIRDRFPIYHIDTEIFSYGQSTRHRLRAVEVDRVRFAEGDRYVVHVVGGSYR